MTRFRGILGWTVVAAWLVCAGCATKPSITYFADSADSFYGMGRVVMIGLRPEVGGSKVATTMTEALFKAVQQRKLFHLDVIGASDPACRDLPLRKRGSFSAQEFRAMREGLDSGSVLFGSVTHFQTHPRMQIGLYLRLVDLAAGKLVWSVDHTWDTTDRVVEERMKDFFDSQMRDGYTPADWRLAMMSPRTFQKFVAYEVANTLPLR